MPPLPTISGVDRVTWNYSPTGGVTAHNVMHFRSGLATVEELRDAIFANWTTNMISCLPDGVGVDSIDILPLNGVAAGSHYTVPVLSVIDGQATGELLPPQAGVLSLHTGFRGPRGRGRLFLGPCAEGAVTHGFLATGFAASITAAWTAFLEDMSAANMPMVVASYTHADANDVLSVSVRSALGTVRRRQDQLV